MEESSDQLSGELPEENFDLEQSCWLVDIVGGILMVAMLLVLEIGAVVMFDGKC